MSVINPVVVSIAKLGSNILVSSGVSTIVGYAAKSAVPKIAPVMLRKFPVAVKAFHGWQKVAIPAGALALAGLASDKAVKYADEQIDLNVKAVEGYILKAREAAAKAQEAAEEK